MTDFQVEPSALHAAAGELETIAETVESSGQKLSSTDPGCPDLSFSAEVKAAGVKGAIQSTELATNLSTLSSTLDATGTAYETMEAAQTVLAGGQR